MDHKDDAKSQVYDLVLKNDDKEASQSTESQQNLLQKIVGLLGVPGFILNIFGPQILKQARRYPRLFSFLAPLVVLFSGAATFTYLVWPLFNAIVGDWLPFAKLKSDDPLYEYLCRWVHYRRQPLRQLEFEASSAGYKRRQGKDRLWWPQDHVGTKDICYEKAGKRYFWYKGTLFILEIAASQRRHFWDVGQDVKLKAIAFSHAPIKDVLNQAWVTYQREEGSRTTKIWHYCEDCWMHLAYKDVRPLDTVDMVEDEKANLVHDLKTYLSDDTQTWYRRRGIPYRRGYLFHGPPGTGKTSLSMAIAGHFNLDMYVLSLANPKLSDTMLASLMTQINTPAVLLLEDVDSAGLTREISVTVTDKPPVPEDSEDEDDMEMDKLGRLTERVAKCNVTLSGVLNALDGAASPEGHILIMSTNAPEALDPALARAGRIDYRVEFNNANHETAKNIFKRMIGEQEGIDLTQKADEFASQIPEGVLSPAELQGYLLNHIGDVNAAMKGLRRWVKRTLKDKEEEEKKLSEEKAKAKNDAKNDEKKEESKT